MKMRINFSKEKETLIIDVPEGNTEDCNKCPFLLNEDICKYLNENVICGSYDFTKLHIEEYEDRN